MKYIGTSTTTYNSFLTLKQEFEAVHGAKYTYDKVLFFNARTPIIITCPIHGDFAQRPRDHKRGQGCKKCYRLQSAATRTRDIKDTIEKVLSNDRFIYPELTHDVILKSHDSILTICKECGNSRNHKICNILSGHAGCRICLKSLNSWSAERYQGKETILYFIRINDLYKVGLTQKSVSSRYYKELKAGYDIEVLFTITYANGAEAFKEEQRIIKDNSQFRYKGDKVLIDGGDSELFVTNIFSNTGGVSSML